MCLVHRLKAPLLHLQQLGDYEIWPDEMVCNWQEKGEFQHVIRILNTNIDGKRTVMYALTKIKV